MMKHNLSRVFTLFDIPGQYVGGAPYGSGHINDTYAVVIDQAGVQVRYIFQRINHEIFKDPISLMSNISRVTSHLTGKLRGRPDASRKTLTLLPSRQGGCVARDDDGLFWRAYIFIENARTYDAVVDEHQAREAARAFGMFQNLLVDLPHPPLFESIPDFHHTPKRFKALLDAIDADIDGRVDSSRKEIDFFLQHEPDYDQLTTLQANGIIPLRTTHNDTKLNNVMIDDATGEGLCVIDLDTVMPGLALYDFGDLVRTATSPAKEDERDLSRVFMQLPMFSALVRGYLDSAGAFLNQAEMEQLSFAGKLITLETGMRFLTDYLKGDTYFKVHRPGHNLDRCRTQCQLVQSIESQMDAMIREVETIQDELKDKALK